MAERPRHIPREIARLARDYCGAALPLTLEDGNLHDDHIRADMKCASEDEDAEAMAILTAMLVMRPSARRRLYDRVYQRNARSL